MTARELEARGSRGWLLIHGKVYDVKALGETLPCGADKLAEYVGRDATKAFEMAGHSDAAKDMMEQCLVGQFSEVCVCVCVCEGGWGIGMLPVPT